MIELLVVLLFHPTNQATAHQNTHQTTNQNQVSHMLPACIYEDGSELKKGEACTSNNGNGYVLYQVTKHGQLQFNTDGTVEFYHTN